MTTPPADAISDGFLRVWRRLRWYAEGVLGADAYRNYLDHHGRTHPGEPPLDERAFWRDHLDWQDRNPQGRCC